MNIIIGKTAGFCFGVKNAVDNTINELNKGEKVYCLGELVHNKQVIENLQEKGLIFIEELDEIKEDNSKVIIRAHGIEKNIYNKAKKKGIKLIDNTCPNVLKIHKLAQDYQKEGYFIFLTGTKNHPENIGTISYCGENFYLIEDENNIKEAINYLEKTKIRNVLLISQTTYSTVKFKRIEEILKQELKDYNFIIKNTICLATELRQKETEEISKKVDMMIIIGGKNSSNTKKLYEIASLNCNKTVCIETKEDINLEDFKNIKTIGIMAGASTPQKSIDEVIKVIQ